MFVDAPAVLGWSAYQRFYRIQVTDARIEDAVAAADEAHREWSRSTTVADRAALQQAAERAGRLAEDDGSPGAGDLVRDDESRDAPADDDDAGVSAHASSLRPAAGRQSCTVCTSAVSTAGSVSIGTP